MATGCLAAAAGVGATACSLLERGLGGRLSVRAARAIAGAVDLPLTWDIGWHRQEVDRLLDASHSALAAHLAQRLGANRFDLRGRGAVEWLRQSQERTTGRLFLTKLPSIAGSDVRKAGRRRVRVRKADPRSASAAPAPMTPDDGG